MQGARGLCKGIQVKQLPLRLCTQKKWQLCRILSVKCRHPCLFEMLACLQFGKKIYAKQIDIRMDTEMDAQASLIGAQYKYKP